MAAVKSTRKPIKTELQLDKLKAFGKPYDVKVHYLSGLYIRVGVSGLKSYRWDRGRNQKPRHITYGHYPALPLKEARDQHEKLQERYRDGAVVEISSDVPKTIKELSEIFSRHGIQFDFNILTCFYKIRLTFKNLTQHPDRIESADR